MRRNLAGIHLTLALCWCVPAADNAATDFPPSTEAVRAEVSAVVHAQVDAIKGGDWPGAYGLAASGIHEKFDLAGFERMIRSSYPALLRPRVATTLRANDNGVQAVLELRVIAEAGSLAHFRYFLQLEDNVWRIVGVVPYEPTTVRT
jgi:hypothetical protein